MISFREVIEGGVGCSPQGQRKVESTTDLELRA